MGRVLLLYLSIYSFFLTYSVNAEEAIRITSDKKTYPLTASTLLCIDTLNSYSIDMFLEDNDPSICKTVNQNGLPHGYSDATIWVRSKIHTPAPVNQQWIAELDNALIDYVDLYVIKNGKAIQHFESGDRRPFASRSIKARTYRFPVELTPGTTELLWKIRSQSGINLPLVLYDKEKLEEKDLSEYLLSGIFYGILIILAIYNFVFFIVVRKIIYFYYVAFIVSYGIMTLSFHGFTPLLIWFDFPWLYNDGVLFFVSMCVLFSVLFGQRFLETAINAPRVHTFLNALIIFNMIPVILSFCDLYAITTRLAAFLGVITPIILVFVGLSVLKKNERRAKLYLLAWSLFFFGTTVFSLHKFGLFQGSWFIMHAQQFGVLFKIMVLSYALSDQLQSLLYLDQLTGVANRESIKRLFASAVRNADKNQYAFAVLTLNIDDFKTINDSLTHKAGDELLKKLTDRLISSLPKHNTIIRMGEDEFLILFEHIENTTTLARHADNILMLIRKPFTLDKELIHITASMGIALYPNDGQAYDILIKNSGTALHKAKQLGKNRAYFFNTELDNYAIDHLKLHNDLYRALDKKELFLLYQPKINAKDHTLAGVEVLLRWKHPERGIIPPDIFIQIAEENSVILQITRWMLEESFKKLKQWHEMGWKEIYIAANITAKDLEDKYFLKDLLNLLKQYDLTTDMLELELTERIIMHSCEENIHRMDALHQAGIKVSIDDFGTGYSSFKYLKSYHVNSIKIDKSFIDQIESDPRTAKIVKAMTALGHELGMKVVVEGVENKQQVEMLTKMHCDIIQGYYFDKPLTEEELTAKYFLKR
ncbi:EAL domain-containing protein [Sulfurovum mangrovi]|uniref:EAL domain-containing protein n=1 Tax=Sulfurovum mangrovi TaxID=2893889 RepID=UPI001E6405EB|nr:EAL domain-containing protein [Sulfurovum mangrovi]UFH60454.1 EAL domain-containing protein [Sulfurovum mangrovi]